MEPTRLGRATFLTMIPVTLLALLWVVFGRACMGLFGWVMVSLLFFVLPVAIVAIAISYGLAITRMARPRALTRTETLAQWVMWIGMCVCGAFLPEVADQPGYHSVLTQIWGASDTLITISSLVALAGALAAGLAWVWLLTLLFRRPKPLPPYATH